VHQRIATEPSEKITPSVTRPVPDIPDTSVLRSSWNSFIVSPTPPTRPHLTFEFLDIEGAPFTCFGVHAINPSLIEEDVVSETTELVGSTVSFELDFVVGFYDVFPIDVLIFYCNIGVSDIGIVPPLVILDTPVFMRWSHITSFRLLLEPKRFQ
jgi:hypothetical protein